MGLKAEENLKNYFQKHKIIGLDTMIFIYHFEANQIYAPLTKLIFNYIQMGNLKAMTSSVSLMEILVKPIKIGNFKAASDYKLVMSNFPNLTIVPFDSMQASKGAILRVKYNLRTPDAIQIASSMAFGCTAFISNDLKFTKINEIQIITLDGLLDEQENS